MERGRRVCECWPDFCGGCVELAGSVEMCGFCDFHKFWRICLHWYARFGDFFHERRPVQRRARGRVTEERIDSQAHQQHRAASYSRLAVTFIPKWPHHANSDSPPTRRTSIRRSSPFRDRIDPFRSWMMMDAMHSQHSGSSCARRSNAASRRTGATRSSSAARPSSSAAGSPNVRCVWRPMRPSTRSGGASRCCSARTRSSSSLSSCAPAVRPNGSRCRTTVHCRSPSWRRTSRSSPIGVHPPPRHLPPPPHRLLALSSAASIWAQTARSTALAARTAWVQVAALLLPCVAAPALHAYPH